MQKNQIVVAIAIGSILWGGCDQPKTATGPDTKQVTVASSETSLPRPPSDGVSPPPETACESLAMDDPNVVDPSQIEVGETVMNLELVSLSAHCLTLGRDAAYYGHAAFRGEVTVGGVVRTRYQLPGSEGVCFDVMQAHDRRLPRLLGDRRKPWFCFNNPEQVVQQLGGEGDYFSMVVIDEFSIAHEPKDVMNRATLIKVIDPTSVTGTDIIQVIEGDESQAPTIE